MSGTELRHVVRTDVRFLLPEPVETVQLVGAAKDLAVAFERVGVEVVERDGALVYGMGGDIAAVDGRAAVAVEGSDARRELRRAGLAARGFLPLPGLDRATVVLPLDEREPTAYAVRNWGGRPDGLRALRNRLAPVLLARGIAPPGRARLTLGVPRPGAPFLVAAAAELGVPADAALFLSPGASDLLSRGVLHVFPRGAREPHWAIKFSRVAGNLAPFEREERGLRLAAEAGEPVASHAPRLLGRFSAGGVPASLETAARGERLVSLLESTDSRASKLAALDRIAGWLVDVGRRTAVPGALGPELERLRSAVLPAWAADGAGEELLDGLDALPAVLVHDDLGSWNVLVDGDAFTAVDWEGARRHGLPLWDLLYLLAYATLPLDRVPVEAATDALVDLFLGRSPSSPFVFGWIRRAVAALGTEPAVVARLATLAWLHHGLSRAARSAAVGAAGGVPSEGLARAPHEFAARWLSEPGLGAGWSAWR
jgi:hypothetical protein